MRIPFSLSRAVVAAVAGTFVLAAPPAAAQPVGDGVFRYGFTARMSYDINPADARAASLVWARGIADQVGLWTRAEAEVFPDASAAVASVSANKTDILALTSLEYLSVEHTLKADPGMVFMQGNTATEEYVLLARQDIKSVADLAGKRVAVFSASGQRDLSYLWLEVLLMEAGIQPDSDRMPSLRTVTKRSQAAMLVFFKQMDAAVEMRSAFETAVEMNPQLGRDLKVVARSPGLLPGVVCLNRSIPPGVRQRYMERAVRLHELPQFRQTFVLMRITRLLAWDPLYLDTTRALVARREALRKRVAR
jgi:ABC-type phosphate/phosphonate transport system substrate-binding protein